MTSGPGEPRSNEEIRADLAYRESFNSFIESPEWRAAPARLIADVPALLVEREDQDRRHQAEIERLHREWVEPYEGFIAADDCKRTDEHGERLHAPTLCLCERNHRCIWCIVADLSAERDEARARVADAAHRLRLLAERTADYTAEGVSIRLNDEADRLAAVVPPEPPRAEQPQATED